MICRLTSIFLINKYIRNIPFKYNFLTRPFRAFNQPSKDVIMSSHPITGGFLDQLALDFPALSVSRSYRLSDALGRLNVFGCDRLGDALGKLNVFGCDRLSDALGRLNVTGSVMHWGD
jgi:hypothetical protein